MAVWLAALAAAGLAAPGTHGVAEVIANIAALDGQMVRVRGWIVGCNGGFDCTLAEDRDARDRKRALVIGRVDAIEDQLLGRDGEQVVLEARVTAKCRSPDYICLDRGPDLIPIRFIDRPGAALPRSH